MRLFRGALQVFENKIIIYVLHLLWSQKTRHTNEMTHIFNTLKIVKNFGNKSLWNDSHNILSHKQNLVNGCFGQL